MKYLVIIFFMGLGFTISLEAILEDDSLVLYLSFDEGKGTRIEDGSIYNHEATNSNPIWIEGKANNSLMFDGLRGNYVEVPLTDELQLVDRFSIGFWMKPEISQKNHWNYMVSAGYLKWSIVFNKDFTDFWSKSEGRWAQKIRINQNLSNEWTHIIVTHDVHSELIIYYDGIEVGFKDMPPLIDEIEGSITIGGLYPGEQFFTGAIDEVLLFNRIITSEEIERIIKGDLVSVDPNKNIITTWSTIKSTYRSSPD